MFQNKKIKELQEEVEVLNQMVLLIYNKVFGDKEWKKYKKTGKI